MWPECLHYIYKRKVLLVSALFRGPAFPNYLHVKQRGENTNQIQEVLLILTPSEKNAVTLLWHFFLMASLITSLSTELRCLRTSSLTLFVAPNTFSLCEQSNASLHETSEVVAQ